MITDKDRRWGNDPKISTSNRRLFAAGQFGKSVPWVATDLLLAWHLHGRVGLGGSTVGTLMLAFNVVGGASTLLLGIAFARWSPKLQFLLRLQFVGALVMASGFLLQFMGGLVPLILAGGIIFRLGYAAEDLPQNIVSARLPSDAADVGRYARVRIASAFLARLLITGGLLLLPIGAALPLSSYLVIASSTIGGAGALLFIRGRTPSHESRAAPPPDGDRRVDLVRIAGLVIGTATLLPVASRLVLFLPDAARPAGSQPQLLFLLCAGATAGPRLMDMYSRWRGRIAATILALLLVISSGFMLCAADTPVWLLSIAAVGHGVAFGWFNARLWEEIAAAVRADGRSSGLRREGLLFALIVTGVQLCNAAGAYLVGLLVEGVENAQASALLLSPSLAGAGAICCAVLLLRPMERIGGRSNRG